MDSPEEIIYLSCDSAVIHFYHLFHGQSEKMDYHRELFHSAVRIHQAVLYSCLCGLDCGTAQESQNSVLLGFQRYYLIMYRDGVHLRIAVVVS